MTHYLKTTALVVLTLLMMFTTVAQDEEAEYAQLEERESVILLLDWTPNTNHTGFYVAQALGFYDDANLDVEIIEPTDLAVESAVETGVADFGIGFQEFTSFAIAEGADVVSIAAIIQHNTSGFATLAEENPLESPADLADLTYGGWGLPLENALISQLVNCDDAEWDTDQHFEVGVADPLELMRLGRVDFAWIFYGWQGISAELTGDELDTLMLMDYTDCVPDYYTPILLTSGTLIEERPEVAAAFVQATARGYEVAIEDPEAAAEILIEAVPELDADLVNASALWLSEQYQADAPRWGEQSEEVWQDFTDFLVEHEMIEEAFDAESVFTNEFLPETE